MTVFLIVILTLEIFFLSLIEKILYKKYITPFTLLSIPYLIIVLLTVILGPKLGFKSLYPPSILYWIFGLPVFWIPGVMIRYFFLKNEIHLQVNSLNINASNYLENSKRWLLFLAWLGLFISMGGLLVSVNKFGIVNLGEEKFTAFYGGGLSGHALVFNIIPFIFFIGTVKRTDKFILITMLIIFITFFLCQVKTWVMIPMISGLLLRYYLGNITFSLKNIIYIIITFIIIFFTIYFLSIDANFEILKKFFFEYLFAGTLGLSEHLRNHIIIKYDPFFLINPIRSIFNFITGNEMQGVVQKVYVNILAGDHISSTNVRTFFGTIFLNSSLIGGTFYIIALSLFIHFLFGIFLHSRNIWIVLMTTFFLGGLALGWFDMWFNHLNYYEISVYVLIMMGISQIQFPRIRLKKY